MFNQKMLRLFLGASWCLVLWAATPWAPSEARWLAGFVLAATYALCAVVFGATDHEALDMVRAEVVRSTESRGQDRLELVQYLSKCDASAANAEKAADRVSKAISELRQENSLR